MQAKTRTYLDCNATCPMHPEAREAMIACLDSTGNASSVHAEGRAARRIVDDAREILAQALGCLPDMVVWTSGGTEANNMALKGINADRMIVAATEHPSVLEAAHASARPVEILPVDRSGAVRLNALEDMLSAQPSPAIVSVMLANNETGVLQPISEVSQLVARHGGILHVDAVQAVGKIPVKLQLLGADLLTVSAHKFGGPQGIGALIVRDGLELTPILAGGGQERYRRAGTENVAAIAGFAAAIRAIGQTQPQLKRLQARIESLLQEISPQVVILAREADRLPNTTCFALPGLDAETAVIGFDLEGVAVSSGSACSSGKVARSHVLGAMGIEPDISGCAVRMSTGWQTSDRDIELFADAWRTLVKRHQALAAA